MNTPSSNPAPASSLPTTPHPAPSRETAPEDKVPMMKRIAYGLGNLSDHIGVGTVTHNANPIFNVALGLDPRLIGISMGIMRLWDAISNPIIGSMSDNCRSSMGRRKPFMLIGAIGCGITFPLIWMVPHGLTSMALFAWFTIFAILYFTFQSVFTIPWTGLGFELTPDYHERTRVMEMRAYLGTAAGIFAPWAYAVTQLPMWKGDVLLGTRYMGVIFGIVIVITGLIPALTLSERFFKAAKKQDKISIWRSIGLTLKNKPFVMMVLITLFTVVGSTTVNHLGFYINLYYLYHGDTAKVAVLSGIGGNMAVVVGVLSVFVLNRLSRRFGKRHTLAICLGLLVLSSFAKWLFLTPKYPYLSLMVVLFTTPAVSGFWLLIASIKADICDYDELETGMRREGSFGAIAAWISKMAYSVTAVLAGVVLSVTGYHAAMGADQAPEVIDRMRWCYYVIPSATAIPALLLLYYFPISEAKAHEIREKLEARRGKL